MFLRWAQTMIVENSCKNDLNMGRQAGKNIKIFRFPKKKSFKRDISQQNLPAFLSHTKF